ncbi:hypothetical protein UY3_05815 [Chelonia mydas]|uniref:Reverse transcriptase domain-containing protein n=1 Tax=Chelonia mydas TaxID=8469 RepID=M7BMR4_CHEMY|nr:hypothetical protein UY3_05815 [Chelonia mydas]
MEPTLLTIKGILQRLYADDLALLADIKEELVNMVSDCLKVNTKKTEVTQVEKVEEELFEISGEKLNQKNRSVYLGIHLVLLERELKRRAQFAWMAVNKIAEVLWDWQLRHKRKGKVYAVIKSVLTDIRERWRADISAQER